MRASIFLYKSFLRDRQPPGSTLFPYTTLFRSQRRTQALQDQFTRGGIRCTRSRDERWPTNGFRASNARRSSRSEEHTSELQSLAYLVCRLLLEKKNIYLLL